ncbi:hypothetical protein [Catelliglobosispora koreensis]|uniref:hypothetical protein n=1 Tax=Catelliglobosispora koreensis TaxID=129052 RepID=UPI00037C6DCD|nr:hypothetical protein [Catelliglobosispora koreensis]
MTKSLDFQRVWHVPAASSVSQLAVIVPVGPNHDPADSVARSDDAAQGTGTSLMHIVVVNGENADRRAADLIPKLHSRLDRVVLVSNNDTIGYVRAVQSGMTLAVSLGLRTDRVGFLDADAQLRSPQHWQVLGAELDSQPELDAISGLVIHEQCQIWETLSSATFIAALELATGQPVTKPYLQGGAGGTLARWQPFANAVQDALRLNTLIGPTLSATSIASGRRVAATSTLPCGHTPRRTMKEWADSVTAYEHAWRGLIDLLGSDIEKPWREFLVAAEHALRDRHKLLVDIRYNGALRQQIVMRVTAERLMLQAGAAR